MFNLFGKDNMSNRIAKNELSINRTGIKTSKLARFKLVRKQEFLKGFVLAATLLLCIGISWIMNLYDPGGNVYTHLFYFPVIISSIWFGRKTFFLVICLSIIHLIIEKDINGSWDYNPFVRVIALNVVSISTVILMKRIRLLYEKVKLQNESIHQMNESMGDVMGRCELNGNIQYVSPSVTRILGYSQEEVMGRNLLFFIDKDSRINIQKALTCAIAEVKEVCIECIILSKYGGSVWAEISVNPIMMNSNCIGIVFRCSDISERKKNEEVMREAINKDGLTGIYNRRFIDNEIEQCFVKNKNLDQLVCALMLDIDFFKHINDKYGHPVGDTVLIKISKIMKNLVGSRDYVARFGGEEFMIILQETDKVSAFVLAERIRIAIEKYNFEIVGHITISIGIACCNQSTSKETLYEKVDKALYVAKERGRNQVAIYCENGFDLIGKEQLNWKETWSSGNREIDTQHKKLFEYLKEIIQKEVNSSSGISISNMLENFNGELFAHFLYEENILKVISYPELQEHIEKHNLISQKVDKIFDLVNNRFVIDTVIIAQLLSECVIDHLEFEDKKYFSFMPHK